MPRAREAQPPSTKPPRATAADGRPAGKGRGRGWSSAGQEGDVLHLSCVLGIPVVAPDGHNAGRLADVIARLAGTSGEGAGATWHPLVTGLVVDFEGQERFADAYQLLSLDSESAKLSVDPKDLGLFERRPGEMLLGRDLRSRHLIHLEGARLVRANEIELAKVGPTWQVMGVDTGSRPVLRRALPRRFRHLVKAGHVWSTGRTSSLSWPMYRRLA